MSSGCHYEIHVYCADVSCMRWIEVFEFLVSCIALAEQVPVSQMLVCGAQTSRNAPSCASVLSLRTLD